MENRLVTNEGGIVYLNPSLALRFFYINQSLLYACNTYMYNKIFHTRLPTGHELVIASI